MPIANNPKVNGIYYAINKDMKLKDKNGNLIWNDCHCVIVTSNNKSKKTAEVKTITLVVKLSNVNKFNNDKLSDIVNGNLLIIPVKQLNSRHLSAVNQKNSTFKLNQLLDSTMGFKFSSCYKK